MQIVDFEELNFVEATPRSWTRSPWQLALLYIRSRALATRGPVIWVTAVSEGRETYAVPCERRRETSYNAMPAAKDALRDSIAESIGMDTT